MKKLIIVCLVLFASHSHGVLLAQTMPKEELIFLTSEWKGDRFPDGRPKIPDDLIKRARNVTVEDVWTVLRNEGYINQYDGNWKMIHQDVTIAGRAVTAMFMPTRPDIEKNIKDRGAKQGRTGNTNAWPIDGLTKGDVYVADGFGKIKDGTLMGDNLGNSIYAKSGNGVIFDGSARDLDGLSKIQGFNALVRDWHPSFLLDVVLMGLNTPIRIGQALVLPGDLVLAKRAGVVFIPAHLAEKVVKTAEFIIVRDMFGHAMLKEGRYTTGQIDSQWPDEIRDAFIKWIAVNAPDVPLKRSDVDEFMKNRTW